MRTSMLLVLGAMLLVQVAAATPGAAEAASPHRAAEQLLEPSLDAEAPLSQPEVALVTEEADDSGPWSGEPARPEPGEEPAAAESSPAGVGEAASAPPQSELEITPEPDSLVDAEAPDSEPTAAPDGDPAAAEGASGELEPAPVLGDEPALAVEDEPALAVEDEPALAVEDEPALAVEDEPAPVLEDEPALAVEDEPAPVLEDEPVLGEEPLPVLGEMGYDAQGQPGRIHVVVPGDTLWDISDAYLGTAWVWPSIWKDNREIENPHLIRPGDRIWITPSEMRRVSAKEAMGLLAGRPADAEPAEPQPLPAATPEPVEVPPEGAGVVPEEKLVKLVSSRERAGLISAEMLESSASVVGNVSEAVMLGQGDQVYIGLGEGDLEVGDQFTIFRAKEKVRDPDTDAMIGYHVDILGWLEVTEPGAEASLGEIRQSQAEIEVGDRVMPREPLPLEIAVQPSPVGLEGKISFFADSRTMMGTTDFVYLNRGALDGLEVGSPLEVYRLGYLADEPARGEEVRVPDRVVAQLLVVRAQPESAVAFVTYTSTELELGDRFRGATQ